MKTDVERVDDITVKLSVTVEAKRVGDAINEAARHLAEEVTIPGFRPGKVPRRVLESRIGRGAVVEHAMRDFLPDFYSQAVREADLDVLGPPQLDVDIFEEGKDAAFTATVEVRPEIELPDYSQLRIAHPEWEVDDDELSDQLDELRERFAELETVQRAAKAGDYVVATITGTSHGNKVDEASGEDLLYEVEDPEETDAEIDRQLVGSTAGVILKFNDTLGPDFGERAGDELAFTVIVKEVKAKRLPDLDDDFAITASEFDTIDELRADLARNLAVAKRAQARAALRGRVVEELCEQIEVPLPESLVQEEARFRASNVARQAEQHGLSFEQFLATSGIDREELIKQFEADARTTVKARLVVDAVGNAAEIPVSQEDLGAEVARQAARLGQPAEDVARFMTQPERLGALVSDVFRRKAIDHLLAQVQVLSAPPADDADLAPPDETADVAGEAVEHQNGFA